MKNLHVYHNVCQSMMALEGESVNYLPASTYLLFPIGERGHKEGPVNSLECRIPYGLAQL